MFVEITLRCPQKAPHARTRRSPTSGVRHTKLATWSSGHQSRCPTGQILKDIFWEKKLRYREQTDYPLHMEGAVLRHHCSVHLLPARQEEPGAITYFGACVKAHSAKEKTKKYDFGHRPSSPETYSMAGRACVRRWNTLPCVNEHNQRKEPR